MSVSGNSNRSSTVSVAAAAVAVGAGYLLGAASTWLWEEHRRRCRNQFYDRTNNNYANPEEDKPAPRRFGGAIRLKPEQYRRYRELHDNVWDQVLERMYQSNIRNFAIYYHKETSTLFQSFEWIGHWQRPNAGKDEVEAALFQRDMDAIVSDPTTRSWWMECEPCQEPFAQWKTGGQPPSRGGSGGDWWAPLECVCHAGHWPTAYSMQRRDPDFVKLKDRSSS